MKNMKPVFVSAAMLGAIVAMLRTGAVADYVQAFRAVTTDTNSIIVSHADLVITNAGGTVSFTNAHALAVSASADALKWDGGTNSLVAATARASLGLGTAAQSNAAAFATAAEGALAANAFQYDEGSYVIVELGDTDVANAAALRTAYAAACLLTPNGAALSASNRAAVMLPPARYDVGTNTLVLATNYVDLVAMVPEMGGLPLAADIDYADGTTALTQFRPPPTYIYTTNNVTTVEQSAADVRVSGFGIAQLSTVTTGNPQAFFGSVTNNAGSVYSQMYFWHRAPNSDRNSVGFNEDLRGDWHNCVANGYAYRIGYNRSGGVFAPTMVDCWGGVYSFAGDAHGEGNGTIDGARIYRCRAVGQDHVGLGSGYGGFGGCGAFAIPITANSIFIDCEAGGNSFGLSKQVSGTFIRCRSGSNSFGSGNSGAGQRGIFDGYAEDCIAGANSFGGTGSDANTWNAGTLVRCTVTNSASYPMNLKGATIRDCRFTVATTNVHAFTLLDGNSTILDSQIEVNEDGTALPVYAASALNVIIAGTYMNNGDNDADGLGANVTNLIANPLNIVKGATSITFGGTVGATSYTGSGASLTGLVNLDMFNNHSDAGRVWGGTIIATNAANIVIQAGGGYVKNETATLGSIPDELTDGQGSGLTYVSWGATNLTMATGYNIVYWDASAGAFASCLKADMGSVFDFTRDFTVGRVYYDAAYGPVARLCGMNRWNKARRVQIFHEQIHPVEVGSGGVVSSSGLQLAVTAAEVWAEGENYFTTSAKLDAANFYYWRQVSNAWTYAATPNIDATNYNVIAADADGLAEMTANRWRTDYVYLVHDGSVHVVMGQAQYVSQALAEAAARPTPPDICAAYGTLIARVSVQKSASTVSVANQDNTAFASASIPEHNDLSGLQGGTAGEYNHLTNAQVALVNAAVQTNHTGDVSITGNLGATSFSGSGAALTGVGRKQRLVPISVNSVAASPASKTGWGVLIAQTTNWSGSVGFSPPVIRPTTTGLVVRVHWAASTNDIGRIHIATTTSRQVNPTTGDPALVSGTSVTNTIATATQSGGYVAQPAIELRLPVSVTGTTALSLLSWVNSANSTYETPLYLIAAELEEEP